LRRTSRRDARRLEHWERAVVIDATARHARARHTPLAREARRMGSGGAPLTGGRSKHVAELIATWPKRPRFLSGSLPSSSRWLLPLGRAYSKCCSSGECVAVLSKSSRGRWPRPMLVPPQRRAQGSRRLGRHPNLAGTDTEHMKLDRNNFDLNHRGMERADLARRGGAIRGVSVPERNASGSASDASPRDKQTAGACLAPFFEATFAGWLPLH
jgi:hypothetical protein